MAPAIVGVSNHKKQKFKVSNFSLTFQIILINLLVILISFLLFGLYNFYSISKDLNIENKTNEISKLSNRLVRSIENNAIKFPLYSEFYTTYTKEGNIINVTKDEILVQKNKEELEPYSTSIIVEGYINKDSEIKVYDSKLNLISESKDFYKVKIIESEIDESKKDNEIEINSYLEFVELSEIFVNFWHLYNKNRFREILIPSFNETVKITEVIKDQETKNLYYTDENNSIFIKIISPLIKNNDIYGVVVVTSPLSNVDNIIGNLSSNLFNNLIVTIFIVILLSIFFARSIAQPIKKLSEITNKYKENKNISNFNQQFPERDDEIGQLSVNLKDMYKKLFSRIEELEKFAADVSHELKNPLTSIIHANEILNKDIVKNQGEAQFNTIIEKQTSKMIKLISDISNYTRQKVEMDKLPNEEIDIKKLLSDIIFDYKDRKKSIKLLLEMENNSYVTNGNYENLARAFTSLIDNAISFSPKNESILIKFEQQKDYGLIYVIDQGPGVKYEYRDKIFNRFYTDRKDEVNMHSGLGLDIAKSIIESYNGSVYLIDKTIKGYKGACFVVKLPIKEI